VFTEETLLYKQEVMPFVYRLNMLLTSCTASKLNYTYYYDHVSKHLALEFYNKPCLVTVFLPWHIPYAVTFQFLLTGTTVMRECKYSNEVLP